MQTCQHDVKLAGADGFATRRAAGTFMKVHIESSGTFVAGDPCLASFLKVDAG